jgi:hypothetical protein
MDDYDTNSKVALEFRVFSATSGPQSFLSASSKHLSGLV